MVPETSEESEGSIYFSPASSEFGIGDVPYFLDFSTNSTPPFDDPMTSDSPLLPEELEGTERENRDPDPDYRRSLRSLEARHRRLLEDMVESDKAQTLLMQSMASIAACNLTSRLSIRD